MATLTVQDIISAMESAYPPSLAEPWDAVGLICGDPAATVGRIHLALDPVAATVDEAIASGADMLITHHPLYLRGTSTVAANHPKGSLIHRLIKADCALFNAHTNGDSADEGTAVVLAELLGLSSVAPLDPRPEDSTIGLGRYGTLPEPIAAGKLGQQLAELLPATARGIALGGDPDRIISTIALCPGAGDSYLDAVRERGLDAMLTSDLRHHPASEALEFHDGPVLFETAHWATESPWLARAAEVLARELGPDIEITVSALSTDPWTMIYLRKEAR